MKLIGTAILLVLIPQDVDPISRSHAPAYRVAVRLYESASQVADSDPKRALEILDQVFNAPEVNTKDRLVAIEPIRGGVARATEFYPHLARARAKLAMAKVEAPSDSKKAMALVKDAIGDLKKSVDAGVPRGKPILDAAELSLKRLAAAARPSTPGTPSNPSGLAAENAAEKNFLDSWAQLIQDRKFKSARDFVEQKGGFLSSAKRSEYSARTEEACRKHVGEALDEFVRSIELTPRPYLLRALTSPDFQKTFALPQEAELFGAYPTLDWAKKQKAALERYRSLDFRRPELMMPVFDLLLPQIVAAEPLEKAGLNRWFRASSQFTYHVMEEEINLMVQQAKESAADRRQSLREQAEKLRARWCETQMKLPREFLARYPLMDKTKAFAVLLDGFPVDLEALGQITVEACFNEEAPDAALERVIADLGKLRDQQLTRLSKEDQRKLLTELVAAQAAHGFLEGKSVETVSKEVQEAGKPLAQAGGPLVANRWGPKIEKVLLGFKP